MFTNLNLLASELQLGNNLKTTMRMKYFFIIIALNFSQTCMSQNLTFKNAIQQLYYGVDVKDASYDTILTNFSNVANKHTVRVGSTKLLDNIDMGIDRQIEKKSHVFTFIKSPFNQLKIDSGEITINIGESQKVKKILSVDWCLYFLKKEDAEIFFNYLTTIFTPVSSKQKFEKDKID